MKKIKNIAIRSLSFAALVISAYILVSLSQVKELNITRLLLIEFISIVICLWVIICIFPQVIAGYNKEYIKFRESWRECFPRQLWSLIGLVILVSYFIASGVILATSSHMSLALGGMLYVGGIVWFVVLIKNDSRLLETPDWLKMLSGKKNSYLYN